tara:strand:+ start:1236 stop:1946 length:711 start_codon:yes stop_codon:yes gene_type:complete
MSIKNKYKVLSVKTEIIKEWFLKKHYAKRIPSISYCFQLLDENNMTIGVCSFGRPIAHPLVKNAFKGHYQENFLELNRLVTNDNLDKNSCSFFISQCLKQLPKPKVIVSYADSSQNHHGYVYQATNWIYTGLSSEFMDYMVKGYENLHSASIMDMVGRSDTNGHLNKVQLLKKKFGEQNVYQVERPRKHRYFYLLGNKNDIKNMRKHLKYTILPYPKGNNINYDASYTPSIQTSIF